MIDVTILKLKTLHPKGMTIIRTVNEKTLCYTIKIQEEDTTTFKMLKDNDVLNQYELPTFVGMQWAECTLRMFGGKPHEAFNTSI